MKLVKSDRSGFTIIELLVVATLIALLTISVTTIYKEVVSRARAGVIATESKAIIEGFDLYAQKLNLTEWPQDDTMTNTGNNPYINDIIAQNPLFAQYVRPVPRISGLQGLEWRYDNEGNTFTCGVGNTRQGVSLTIRNIRDMSIVEKVDDAIDGDNDLTCGLLRWSSAYNGTLVYGISNTQEIR